MPAPDDAAVLAAAQTGDRDAIDALLRRHQDRIHGLCRRLLGNDTDALDAAQEAMIAIVRGLPRFDGRSAFSTWIYRVTTNACLDELRRRQRRSAEPLPAYERAEDQPATTSRPMAVEDTVAAHVDIDRALTQLPAEFRVAVVLRDLCRLDYAEIAEVLAIPAGTVRSRISRGRAGLAEILDPQGAAGNPSHPGDRPIPRS